MSVLLTGATGFVGGEVLYRMLRTSPRRVFCLVRAADFAAARERGKTVLATYFGARAARYAGRVEWIPADLEQERLGLDAATFADLAERTEEIFHCAASTRFDLPYAEARAINVTGLQRVHALAEAAQKAGTFRRLNHVSTAYVTGDQSGLVDASVLPEADGAFRNTYEETKAEAERFLRDEGQVPYAVFRPSIVVGDSETGRTTNWNVVYYPMRLMADDKLPYVSSIGAALCDCVPVDWVADAMLALAARDDVDGKTFNLTAGEDAITVDDVVEHTYAGLARRARRRQAEVRTKTLGRFGWALLKRWVSWRHAGAAKALARFEVYEPYTAVQCTMSNAETLRLLAEEGVSLPPMQATFARVVDYALAANFGRDERPAPRRQAAARGALASAVDALASGEIVGVSV